MTTGPAAVRIGSVPLWACTCQRCGHKWEAAGKHPPPMCAKCRTRNWQVGRGKLTRGRPPEE